MIKKASILTLISIMCFTAFAQEKEKPVTFDLYGFVRSELFFDTYRGIGAAEEEYYLVPNYIGTDSEGNDLNEQFTTTYSPLHTRFGFKLNGPDFMGAQTTARLETDFFGIPSNPYVLRLRLAYIQFQWNNSTLLAGQDWHPFFTKQCFPQTTNLNTGTPFHPFSRTPMIRYDYKMGNLKLTGATIFELQFGSLGPDGKSTVYSRTAGIPELLAGIEYQKEAFRIGAMAEYKVIQPRTYTASTTSVNDSLFVTNKLFGGFNYTAFAQYKSKKLMILAKGVYGGLLSHMVMQGGFGVSDFDAETGEEDYTPFNSYSMMLNAQYGGALKVGGFVGYLKNLGAADPLYNFSSTGAASTKQWGRFLNINDMYRGSVSLWYTLKNVSLRTEYELTVANYGEGTLSAETGLYDGNHAAKNNRFNLSVTYFF